MSIMKYPIGIQTFEKIREDGFVYVDKTDMIYQLAHEGTIYFLSRPRRFGKSLLLSTIEAFFRGKKELFKGLKIDSLETEWKEYPVIRIDFNSVDFTKIDALPVTLNGILALLEQKYNVPASSPELGVGFRFNNILQSIHEQTGMPVVVLVDEYDKPLLDVMDTPYEVDYQGEKISLEEYNRNTLKAFYSTFKAADQHLKFVFLTGVTKFSQVSVFSGFNQPEDISMSPQFDTLCGITEDEMEQYFHEPISKMAALYHYSYDEMRAKLRAKYDGYHFSKFLNGVYNPFSLLNAFKKLDIMDYWFQTGTPTYLVRLLDHFNETMDELTGKYYSVDEFINYKADKERPLPMIYQSGYLTIKGYDREDDTFLLDYPNDEVKRGFVSLLANNYLKTKDSVDSWMIAAMRMLRQGKLDDFREQLTAFFASIPYSMRRKDTEPERERYFHYTFYLILRLVSTYMVYTEKQLSHGRADCIIETDKYVYIFEFKLDGTAQEALQQINDKGYATPYAADERQIYKVGCSFSSETGTVEEWAVE